MIINNLDKFMVLIGFTSNLTAPFFGDYEYLIRSIPTFCWGYFLARIILI